MNTRQKNKEELTVENLSVVKDRKQILKGVSLVVKKGEIHALLGPNGAGKSTLALSLLGHPDYRLGKDSVVKLKGQEMKSWPTEKRVKNGFFATFQNPVALPGIKTLLLLKHLYFLYKKNPPDQESLLKAYRYFADLAGDLGLPREILERSFGEDFSGGEKKKLEVLEVLLLRPEFLLLDEVDTGLDIDSLKLIVRKLGEYLKKDKPGVLIISHQQKIFRYLKPDFVHVLKGGEIKKSGDVALLARIEKEGYAKI